jgi:hypothetical protein
MWVLLSTIAVVGLFTYSGSRNGVWGSATIGLIGGFIAASVFYFTGTGFHWQTVGKWIVVSTLLGLLMEFADFILRLLRKKGIRNKNDQRHLHQEKSSSYPGVSYYEKVKDREK